MDVFLDDDDNIRVKTRITERKDIPSFLAPYLLPVNCTFTKLLIESVDKKNCHPGVQILQCILRERFWICKSRRTIRSVVNKCTKCRRYKVEPMLYEPTPLPAMCCVIVLRILPSSNREPRVGEIVLVGNDSKKCINWPLAVIVELVPGRDGNIRNVKVKTQTGVLLRPLQRIFPLEINSNGYHSLDMKRRVDDDIHDLNAENQSPEKLCV
ncbi:uncharacterized protein TNCV_3830421 [Trichonephila clavipes]|nr:uncharacterized protein TNCV_3830421 [Trichonephila clavipes]